MKKADKRKTLNNPLTLDGEPPDEDADTNYQIEKQRQNIHYTIRHGLKINQRANKKAMYKTAGRKTQTCSQVPKTRWGEEDESKHEVKAHIRDTDALSDASEWDTLIGHGITHLTVEDHANALSEIPANLATIQTLRSLTLMWSNVSSLPAHLLQMSLRELYLQKCPLKTVDGLQQMTRLTKLELSNGFLKRLPMEIGEMARLESLVLDGNLLKALPTSIGNLSKLEVLSVCANRLKNLPSTITELENLLTLDASQNRIKDLPGDIGRLANLVTLRMSHNQLSALPESMQQLCSLRNLYLAHNQFTEIPIVLCHMNELNTLNMVGNNIRGFSTPLPYLTTLLLDKNIIDELQTPLFGCVNVQTLSLQFNKITSIPPLINRLTKLRILYLGGNDITELPDEICDLSNLRHLVIRETSIQELPKNFATLNNLSVVDIDSTKLSTRYLYALRNGGVKGLQSLVAELYGNATSAPIDYANDDDTDEECDQHYMASDEEIESEHNTPKIVKRRSDAQSENGPGTRKHIISMWPESGNVPDILRNPPLNLNGPSRSTSTRKEIKTMMPSDEELALRDLSFKEPVAGMAVVWSDEMKRDSAPGGGKDMEMTEYTSKQKSESDFSEISSDEEEQDRPKKPIVRFLSSSGKVHTPEKNYSTKESIIDRKEPTSDSEAELSEMSDIDSSEVNTIQKSPVKFSTNQITAGIPTAKTAEAGSTCSEPENVTNILRTKDGTQNGQVRTSDGQPGRMSTSRPPPPIKPSRLSSRASAGPTDQDPNPNGPMPESTADKRASKPKPQVAGKPDRLSHRMSQNLPQKVDNNDDGDDWDDSDDDPLVNLKASLLSREPSPVIASKPMFQIPPVQSSLHGIRE